ncbi:hypothetical protein HDU98_008121, partial [Podochytrium sp. JEL0797]
MLVGGVADNVGTDADGDVAMEDADMESDSDSDIVMGEAKNRVGVGGNPVPNASSEVHKFYKWEPMADMYAPGSRIKWTPQVKAAAQAKILKSKQPWRFGWHSNKSLGDCLDLAYSTKGYPA